jgi:NLI interacting factor-like phosphatase
MATKRPTYPLTCAAEDNETKIKKRRRSKGTASRVDNNNYENPKAWEAVESLSRPSENGGADAPLKEQDDKTEKEPASRMRKKLRKKAQQQREIMVADALAFQVTQSVKLNLATSASKEAIASLRVTTTSTLPSKSQLHALNMSNKNQVSMPLQIYIQPLLVLDLNGVLCHRLRNNKEPSTNLSNGFRRASCFIANTPVIPRPNLIDFLTFLDEHFCLAVWTSAKTKTAKQLVQQLFPPQIARRLLFVWAQNRCTTTTLAGEFNDDPLFVKQLDSVWKEYPLWNQHNTLLLDDSPDKCPFPRNALHPPSMNGQKKQRWSTSELDDTRNHELQLIFFQKLVSFWSEQQVTTTWDGLGGATYHPQPNALWHFMGQHATKHMGWRNNNDDDDNVGDSP